MFATGTGCDARVTNSYYCVIRVVHEETLPGHILAGISQSHFIHLFSTRWSQGYNFEVPMASSFLPVRCTGRGGQLLRSAERNKAHSMFSGDWIAESAETAQIAPRQPD